MSATFNACLSILDPSGTVQGKSAGVKKAMEYVQSTYLEPDEKPLFHLDIKDLSEAIPPEYSAFIKVCTVEYAGKKFKTRAQTGLQYAQEAASFVQAVKRETPNVWRVIISEEKYLFTPDIFKFATHVKRGIQIQVSAVNNN